MTSKMEGILPALLTPFQANGDVDVEALEQLIAGLYEAGVDGLYVCGQTGEGLAQPVSTRKKTLEIAHRCSPAGKTVIAHVGANRMGDALDLAQHAADAGVQAASSLPPIGQFSFEEIRSYYATLAAACPIPTVLYYFPEAAPCLKSDDVGKLCSLPNVAGVKFTSFDLHKIPDLTRAGAVVFNGRDEVLAPGLLMGATGGIGSFYNIVPDLFIDVQRSAQRGDWQAARRTQDRINDLITVVLRYPLIPALKKILTWSGLPFGNALPPRRPLTAQEETHLRAQLESAGFDPCGFLASRTGARA